MSTAQKRIRMKMPAIVKCLVTMAATLVVAACGAYKPYEYHDERETMQGPGLFSGEDGVFTVYGRKAAEPPDQASDGAKDADEKTEKIGP